MVTKPGKLEVSWRGKKVEEEGESRAGKGLVEMGDDVCNLTTSFPENAV